MYVYILVNRLLVNNLSYQKFNNKNSIKYFKFTYIKHKKKG